MHHQHQILKNDGAVLDPNLPNPVTEPDQRFLTNLLKEVGKRYRQATCGRRVYIPTESTR